MFGVGGGLPAVDFLFVTLDLHILPGCQWIQWQVRVWVQMKLDFGWGRGREGGLVFRVKCLRSVF